MRFLAMAQVGLEPSHTVGCRRGTKVQNRTVGIGHKRFRNEPIRDNSRSRSNFTVPNRENTLILWFSVLLIRPTTDNSKEPQAFAFGSVRFCSVPLELHRTEPQECARVSNRSAVLSEPVKNRACAHIYCTINGCQVRYTYYHYTVAPVVYLILIVVTLECYLLCWCWVVSSNPAVVRLGIYLQK